MNLVYKNEGKLFAIAATISAIVWVLLIVGTLGIGLIYLLLAFIIYLFAQSAFISYIKGDGVRVSETQFPDLNDRLRKCCDRIGMTEVPAMYLLRADVFNALATKFLGRNFIVLFTDVVDALEDQQDAIDFYIGHELGHIHRKHLKWNFFLLPALFLPLLGAAYRRAEEYTCDRYGAACSASDDDIRAALAAISAGDTRWKTLSHVSFMEQVQQTSEFWMSFHEFTNDYPWMSKRMTAALAFRRNEEPVFPKRSKLAGFLALFVPRVGGLGGGGGLIVTIAMIGILAAIAIPAYQDYTIRAQVSIAMQAAAPVQAGVTEYIIEYDEAPASMTDLGFPAEDMPILDGQYSVAIYEGGVVGINMGINAAGNTKYLVLEPYDDGAGGVGWACYGQDLPDKHLPMACRQSQ